MSFTDAEAGRDDFVAGFEVEVIGLDDFADEFTSRNERVLINDFSGLGKTEGILVIECGIMNLDEDVTVFFFWKCVEFDICHCGVETVIFFVEDERLK
jgi:hypothetical protein